MAYRSHTILVVDPDEQSYRTFESALGSKINVWFVPNGKTAIEIPNSQNVDLIFVSHTLDGTDDNLILESFKKQFPSIPVVVLAENPTVTAVLSAFRRGARELILKPLDEKELIAITKKIFGFVSNKKPKHRWFSLNKKDRHNDNPTGNRLGHLIQRLFQKSEPEEGSSMDESDDFQVKETLSVAEDLSNQSIVDAFMDPRQSDKVIRPVEPIKNSFPHIQAFFFGTFQVFVNEQPIENWPSKKGKSIFAYLLLNYKKKIYRDVLMDLFWQKSDPDSARNCLNVTIHGLRRILQDINPNDEYILFKDECYYFNPDIQVELDVEEFRTIWRNAQSIEYDKGLAAAASEFKRAAEIYKGDFLEDELYDDWLSLDRENLKEVFLVILDKISENFIYHNEHYKAIPVCENILEKDNCREDIHRRLMLSYYRIGQRDKAIKQFQKCVEALKEELEVKPSGETTNLFEQLKRDSLITKN
jgi:DNA-binding SARP family transcriptional activator/DNA-binding NarL/FixJ family response regulator